jgi:Maintenance of mitochondrial structure and function
MPVNHQIVYHLQDALNLLPDLSDPTTTQSFASSTNDQLLVVYLSSLLRAVIALHALVDNKATIGRVELEEGGDEKDKIGARLGFEWWRLEAQPVTCQHPVGIKGIEEHRRICKVHPCVLVGDACHQDSTPPPRFCSFSRKLV